MSAKAHLLAQFDLHHVLYHTVLDGISDDEAAGNLVLPMNSVKYLAGHLVWAQGNLARMVGLTIDIPWVDFYKSGPGVEAQIASKDEQPSLMTIKEKWDEITTPLRGIFAAKTEEELSAPRDGQPVMPQFENNLAGWWSFINHHQAFTIGQIAILRRGLNKEPMSYF